MTIPIILAMIAATKPLVAKPLKAQPLTVMPRSEYARFVKNAKQLQVDERDVAFALGVQEFIRLEKRLPKGVE